MKDFSTSNCQSQIIEKLIINASRLYGLPADDITGYTKKPQACIAREMVWMICRDRLVMKYRCIAQYFSDRDLKAISSGIKTMRKECEVAKHRTKEIDIISDGCL